MRLIENELTREVKDIGYEPLIIPSVANYHMYLADVQKWLREEHSLEVSMILHEDSWWFQVETIVEQVIKAESDCDDCNYYEETLEAGVLAALKLLRK